MAVRILVPLDASDVSEQVLPAVQRFTQLTGATEIDVLYVLDPSQFVDLSAGMGGAGTALDDELDWAGEYVAERSQQLTTGNVRATGFVEVGPPARMILDRIADGGIDYVFMASHGRSGFNRVMMGSVTESVVRQSPIPVIVVHPSPATVVAKEGLESKSTIDLIKIFGRQDVLANEALATVVKRRSGAVRSLILAASDPNAVVRQYALRALGLIGDRVAIPHLISALDSEIFEVRWEAAEALCEFKEAGTEAVLNMLLHRPTDARLAAAATHVLDRAPMELHAIVKPVLKALHQDNRVEVAPLAANAALEHLSAFHSALQPAKANGGRRSQASRTRGDGPRPSSA